MPTKFSIIEQGKPSKELSDLLDDQSVFLRYSSFDTFCKKNDYSYSKNDLKILVRNIEGYVSEFLKVLAMVQFRKMEISHEWGDAGEEQCRTSFLRNILQLAPHEDISSQHQEAFESEVKSFFQKVNLYSQTSDSLNHTIKNFKMILFNKAFFPQQWNEISRLLSFLGSKKKFVSMSFGQDFQFIFGDAIVKKIGDHTVTYFVTEDIRSPNLIIPNVAVSQDAEVFIRYDAFRCVFYQKWVPVYKEENAWWLSMPERNISEGIKRKALSYYDVFSVDETIAKEKEFVKDMAETIVYHELGHVVSIHDVLDTNVSAITEGTKVFSYSIAMSLFELLADFAPRVNKIKGPLQNMIDISKTDTKRAEALFYMYLSDVCFYDTYDEYMFIYSDLMILSMLRYIQPDQSINFKKMQHDIYFKQKETDGDKDENRYVNYLYAQLTTTIRKVEMHIKKMEFKMDDQTYNFEQVKAMIEFQFVVNNSKHQQGDYFYIASLWLFLFSAAEKLSPSYKSLKLLFETEKNAIIKRLFNAVFLKDKKIEFNKDYRKHIFLHMMQLGLVVQHDKSEPIDI